MKGILLNIVGGSMAFTAAIHPGLHDRAGIAAHVPAAAAADAAGVETLEIYYSPLESTKMAAYAGFGMAHHMAIVYTDATGASYGASSGPSDLSAAQTPANAATAVVDAALETPSRFGTLVADPKNDTPFSKGASADYYTKDGHGRAYPHVLALRGRDLSAKWADILATYSAVGTLRLTYSPLDQNSNSLAAVALRHAGVQPEFSSRTPFAPGLFTQLPVPAGQRPAMRAPRRTPALPTSRPSPSPAGAVS